jgi:hypothetical protein
MLVFSRLSNYYKCSETSFTSKVSTRILRPTNLTPKKKLSNNLPILTRFESSRPYLSTIKTTEIRNSRSLYNNEGGEFESQPLPLYTTRGGGKASSILSCKKRNFNLKQMNKKKIKLIGRINNPRPH